MPLILADFRSEDNLDATAWHYASRRQLHYCLLIIASYVRKYNRDNGLSGSESDQPNSGIMNGIMVDQKLRVNKGTVRVLIVCGECVDTFMSL